MSSGTVYVIQRPRPQGEHKWVPDLSSASTYGQLRYIFEDHERPARSPAKALEKISDVLGHFDPEQDYLLWPNFADQEACWMIMWVAGFYRIPLQVLSWQRDKSDHGSGCYMPVAIGDLSI